MSDPQNLAQLQVRVTQLETIIRQQHEQIITADQRLAEVTFQRNAFQNSRFGRGRRYYLRWKNRILQLLNKPVVDDNKFPPAIYHPTPPSPLELLSPMTPFLETIQQPDQAWLLPPLTDKCDIIHFSIIEWSHLTQRPQQLMSHLAARGHRVFWVDVQLREGAMTTSLEKPLEQLAPNIYRVQLPAPADLIYYAQLDDVVLAGMEATFDSIRLHYAIDCAVSIVNFPGWWPLVEKLYARFHWKLVYDCLDDQSEFRKLHQFQTQDDETELLQNSGLVVTTSQLLYDKQRKHNPNTVLIRNATDYELFSKPRPTRFLDHLSGPIIGFFGAMHDWLDLDLLQKAAENFGDWQFVFVGRLNFSGAQTRQRFEDLQKLHNVHYIGQVDFADLPCYLAQFTVCTVPFRSMPVTQAMNVVKIYDYLAAGKPIVALDLPETQPFAELGAIFTYRTHNEFLKTLEQAVRTPSTPEQIGLRQKLARQNTWEVRCDLLEQAIIDMHEMVTIIVVTFNNLLYTKLCIESVFSRTRWPHFRLVIVDNGSGQEMLQYLHELESHNPQVHVILNGENLGFARANNRALEQFKDQSDYFLLLNDDTIVTTGWLPRLLKHLSEPGVGLVGPVTSYTGNEARIRIGYESVADMNTWALRYMTAHDGESFDIRMLSAYCILFTARTLKQIGSLDERFHIGMFEDDDFSRRIKQAGMRVVCCEDVFIHHFGRSSFRRMSESEYKDTFNSHRAMFEAKWGEAWTPHKGRPEITGLPA